MAQAQAWTEGPIPAGWQRGPAPTTPPPPTASIGPAMPGTAQPDLLNEAAQDKGPTYDEVMKHPRLGMQAIGRVLKREASDPRTWLTLAAMYFGPKAMNTVGPIIARAARSAGTSIAEAPIPAIRNADPDLVSIASPRAGAILRKAQQLADRYAPETPAAHAPTAPGYDRYMPNATAPPSAPLETAPSSTPAPTGPPAPAAPGESPAVGKFPIQKALNELAIQARRQGATLTEAESQAAAGLMHSHGVSATEAVKTVVALKAAPPGLSTEEASNYAALRAQGKPHNAAMAAIQQMRTLREKFGLPSGEQVTDAVTQRNATGKWPE